ncbi:MAG: hypothetical protein IKO30_10375 [Lachnospiraceae bacterium]|nr:hypothetical protein [Lachnospiraceae bacterium]
MSDLRSIAHKITKGKNESDNWNQFFTEYKGYTGRLAGTQFALNLVSIMMDDHLWQEQELSGIGKEFLEFVGTCEKAGYDISLEEQITEYRKKLKNMMECLVTYNDRYLIYLYVMNISKYRFEDYDMKGYTDASFTDELMAYITKDKDQSNIRYKTMDVLKGLPIRLTKKRFFELVRDGYSVYKGGSMESIKGFDYMLRSAALLKEPEGMSAYFPALDEYDRHFASLDIESLDAEGYYDESTRLAECIDYLNEHISSCQLLAEGINQLYAFILTGDCAFDEENLSAVKKIISIINKVEDPALGYDLDDDMNELLEGLEGVQEEELERLEDADGALEDILSSKFAAAANKSVLADFIVIDKLKILVSSSYFADTDDEDASEVTPEAFLALLNDFVGDISDSFENKSKTYVRALMASCIGCMPMNFENTTKLREYILGSLNACTNAAEKMALVGQLREMMAADMDLE